MQIIAVFLLPWLLLSACKEDKANIKNNFRVGIVLDKGGKDDKSFNSAAVEGAKRAQKEGIEIKLIESADDNAYEPALRSLTERDYDLMIAIGFSQKDAVTKIATQFPQKHFAIVDAKIDLPNVQSLMFAEQEGSYLVGMAAALKSQTHKIGFIGGMEIDLIKRFELAYRAGAKSVDPKIKILSNYVGVTGDAWVNPGKGKEIALAQIQQGADVIFHAAGSTGMGVFQAVEEKKKFAIGVDSNQNWIKPGFILTSMLKRVDVAVENSIEQAKLGSFKPGLQEFNLKNDGIDYAVDSFNEKILDEKIRMQLNSAKKKISSGELKVPDYYITHKME